MSETWALAIDFGTSRTAGAMATDGTVTALEVEGNRWMASMVLLDPDGRLLVGTAADNQAGVYPDRLERTPKRQVGTGAPLVLGGQPVDVADAVAALLAVFGAEGRLRRNGKAPSLCVLTHPVRWEAARSAFLGDAAARAGLPEPQLVEEPVAAAIHYASDQVDPGEYVGVYDLGGGTFDTAVLRRTTDGFETVGAPGGDEHIGGEHFDHHLFRYFGECLAGDDADLWDQIASSDERKWKRAAADLLVQARRAKEALSSYPQTQVFVPAADRDIVVTRAQFESMIRDEVERTVDEMDDTIASAGLRPDDLAAIYLVGGSSRIPLVVHMMAERFGTRVATRDEPKSVVALGAAKFAGTMLAELPETRATVDLAALPPPHVDVAESEPLRVDVAAAPPDLTALPPPRAADRLDAPPATTPALPEPDVVWRAASTHLAGGVAAGDGTVWFATVAGELHALDASDGATRWTATLGGPAPGTPLAIAGAICCGRDDGYVAAVDALTGATRWWSAVGAPLPGHTASGAATVAVGDDAGRVSALDVADGSARWLLPLDAPIRALAGRTATFVAGLADGRVVAIDAETGQVRWIYPTNGAVGAGIAVDTTTAFVPSADGRLYALDLAGGQARWAYEAGGPVTVEPALGQDVVYLAAPDGHVHAIDARTGDARWTAFAGNQPAALAAPATIVVAATGAQLTAFTADGTPVWRTAGHRPQGAGELLVAQGPDGELFAVRP